MPYQKKSLMRSLTTSLLLGLGFICLSLTVLPSHSHALSGSDFQAGNIVSDAIFFSGSAMSTAEIQAFLNAKVPNCDTWGTKMHSSGQTRAQYGASKGYPAPYTCLKNYSQSTPNKSAETALCNTYTGGTKSAAQIIQDVSQACGVSPKVLLVLLQKEQTLVTDDWPWSIQYRSATGFGCPDTAPCDAEYYGFFNQVYNAARIYKKYARDSYLYNYRSGRNNNILWNPSAGCGSSTVYIENQATAGLYIYTPYRPNQAALNNLYGTGDSCSSYGNRNFWRMYHDWFGSTIANCTYPSSTGTEIYRVLQPNRNSYLLTTDPTEVCNATYKYGYIYDGKIASSSTAGSTVYRLQKNGNYLYTLSSAERDQAVQNYGYKLEGEAFKASSNLTSENNLPVYRLLYPSTGGYLYTLSSAERDQAVQNYGYRYEGLAFYVSNTSGLSLNDVYRLAHPDAGYLFTSSMSDKDAAVQGYNFRYEGIGFKTRIGYTADNLPVYRLAGKKGYLLTTNFGERKYAMQLGYRPEGFAFYAYPTDNLGASKQVYRLAHRDGTYLYTSSPSERDAAVQNYGYRYEGIGFRVP